nr:anthranilate synthase component I family protein [Pedobacter glucosidilyticus]
MQLKIEDKFAFKQQALRWANQHEYCTVFDSHQYQDPYSTFDLLIAVDAIDCLETPYGDAFLQLEAFKNKHQSWLIGGFAYDLKNEVEDLTSRNKDSLAFPDLFFFVPKHLILVKGDDLSIISDDAEQVLAAISKTIIEEEQSLPPIEINCKFSKHEYIDTVKQIQKEIAAGNIYETNFCIEFYKEDTSLNPVQVYERLSQVSPTPFSSFFKWKDKYVLCASPERFLAKRGNKIISQPIKGTAKRGKNLEEDNAIKEALANHPKEQQENVMIVDLVRNDLTKSAKKGTVAVEELFGIYSFKQVHQMISTVVCEVDEKLSLTEIIKNTFPMGSMTGAPKIKAMQLMEKYEKSKRGIYSGAIGYITPHQDFDFNVVIRSVLYNESSKYLSFHAGSAITFYADAEKEYEECLLKISAMLASVNGSVKID